jgi:hypothetical protein
VGAICVCEHVFVSAGASPYALLQRALERGSLFQAEAAARECKHVRLDDSLALVCLYAKAAHPRFDAAAVRWLGRLMADHPAMGLAAATDALDAVRGLARASPEVARARLALILSQIGEEKSARVLERS